MVGKRHSKQPSNKAPSAPRTTRARAARSPAHAGSDEGEGANDSTPGQEPMDVDMDPTPPAPPPRRSTRLGGADAADRLDDGDAEPADEQEQPRRSGRLNGRRPEVFTTKASSKKVETRAATKAPTGRQNNRKAASRKASEPTEDQDMHVDEVGTAGEPGRIADATQEQGDRAGDRRPISPSYADVARGTRPSSPSPGQGSPSVRGPLARRSAYVSRASAASRTGAQAMESADAPASASAPQAFPRRAHESATPQHPPSSPPGSTSDSSPPGSTSEESQSEFEPPNASGPEQDEEDQDDGYVTPTPAPKLKKRYRPAVESPSTPRPAAKRPRPAIAPLPPFAGQERDDRMEVDGEQADSNGKENGGKGGKGRAGGKGKAKAKVGKEGKGKGKEKEKEKGKEKEGEEEAGKGKGRARARGDGSGGGDGLAGSQASGSSRPPPIRPPPAQHVPSHSGAGRKRARPDEIDGDAAHPSRRARKDSKGKGKAAAPDGDGDGGNGKKAPPKPKPGVDKGKGKAPPPDDEDDGEDDGQDAHPKRDKGKGKAPPEDADEPVPEMPLDMPGLFAPGDYLDDDAPLPDLDDLISFEDTDPTAPGPSNHRNAAGPSTARESRRERVRRAREENAANILCEEPGSAHAYSAGRLPDDARRRAEELGIEYTLGLLSIAQETNKPPELVFRIAGWMHSDSAHARRWQRANVFRRYWAATNPPDPSVSADERRAQMEAAYRQKVAELGSNPSHEDAMRHFKKEYDFCVQLDEHIIQNATSRQRQRQLDSLAQQFSRLALAANLNNGVAVVGYIVDLHAKANSAMFGGGAVYQELLRRYSGNFSEGLNQMSTLLRACDLRLRGLREDGEVDAGPPSEHELGWFPERNWDLDPDQNRSDEYLRILYELLRWDLGAIYHMANQRLSSRHTAVEPRQFPRTSWPDIAYRLGICLVNWPEVLRNNMPMEGMKRKPTGRTWSNVVAAMVNYRRRAEAESNRRGLTNEAALGWLLGSGVPALVPLPREYAVLPHFMLENNPIVQSPRPPTSARVANPRPTTFIRWGQSLRYQQDRNNGEDSRIKWQAYWKGERDDGLVHEDESDGGDHADSAPHVTPNDINRPGPNSQIRLWAPWDAFEASLGGLRRNAGLFDEDEERDPEEQDGQADEDEGASRADALERLKARRASKRKDGRK
ncbi:hypothetical protein K523DRAFT_356905 [Schizophyllum commune Tattone D]|nr:hypothetical protein K523DRAFT_356905 [Schizophyllum commune Tattone D]